MINRQMKPYELHQLVQGYDKYNRPTKQDWEPLEITIQAALNLKNLEVQANFSAGEDSDLLVRYKECSHFGLTDYRGFDERCTYKLVDDLKEYEIKVINQVTRKTQLHLKELIANE